MADFTGTVGNDRQLGTSGAELFDYSQGGADILAGGGGDDVFSFGAAFTSGDRVHGGTGADTLVLQGDYAAPLTLDQTDLTGVETIELAGAFTYNLQIGEGVVAAGGTLAVSALEAGSRLVLDASAVGDYQLAIAATGGGHTRTIGGNLADAITLATVERTDVIDGGGGQDSLYIQSAVDLKAAEHTFSNILHYHFAAGSHVVLAAEDIAGPGGFVYTADTGTTTVDAHKTSFGPVDMFGGAGDDDFAGGQNSDYLLGGGGDDTLRGGLENDMLEGGAGNDTFVFRSVLESRHGAPDFILDLQATDLIDLSGMDADKTLKGQQHFTLVGAFDGHAGQLVLDYRAGRGDTLLSGDIDGDGKADFRVVVDGDHHDFAGLVL